MHVTKLKVDDVLYGTINNKTNNKVYITLEYIKGVYTSWIFLKSNSVYYKKLNINDRIKVKVQNINFKYKYTINLLLVPSKKLLVLDLNGILIERNYGNRTAQKYNNMDQFLNFCCNVFDVVIWSCSKKNKLEVNTLGNLNRFIAILDQDHSTSKWPERSVVSSEKPLFLKEIEKLQNILLNYNLYYDINQILMIDDHFEKFRENPTGSGLYFDNIIDKKNSFLSDNGLLRTILSEYNCNDSVTVVSNKLSNSQYRDYVWTYQEHSSPSYNTKKDTIEFANESCSLSLSTKNTQIDFNKSHSSSFSKKNTLKDFKKSYSSPLFNKKGENKVSQHEKKRYDRINHNRSVYSNNDLSCSQSSIQSNNNMNSNKIVNNLLKEQFIRSFTYIINPDEYINYNRCPGIRSDNLSKSNYEQVLNNNFKVCEKTDGVRFMLWINDINESYLFNRQLDYFKIENKSGFSNNTILDGELVVSRVGDTVELTYLIFDVIKYDNQDLENGIDDRLEFNNFEKIKIRKKTFYEINDICKVTDKIINNIHYTEDGISTKCDGLVFTPKNESYKNIIAYKWKPTELNTIDLRLYKEGLVEEKPTLYYGNGKNKNIFNQKYFLDDKLDEIREYFKNENEKTDVIVECYLNSNDDTWCIKHLRTDKNITNGENTIINIMNLLNDPLDLEFMKNYINNNNINL
jgi:mRNA guanylyltransferase